MSTRLAVVAGLTVALTATGAAQAAKRHHHHAHPHYAKRGATYKGPIEDGTIEFAISHDGKTIEQGLTISQLTVHCQNGPDHPITKINFEHAFTIVRNHVTYTHEHNGSTAKLSVTFHKGGGATGTVNLHFAPPPPPPPGAIPPGATFTNPGQCDTGDASFSAKPAKSR